MSYHGHVVGIKEGGTGSLVRANGRQSTTPKEMQHQGSAGRSSVNGDKSDEYSEQLRYSVEGHGRLQTLLNTEVSSKA